MLQSINYAARYVLRVHTHHPPAMARYMGGNAGKRGNGGQGEPKSDTCQISVFEFRICSWKCRDMGMPSLAGRSSSGSQKAKEKA